MSNGQYGTHTLTTIAAFVLCLVISVNSAKEDIPSRDTDLVSSIQKREADSSSGSDVLDYSKFHQEPVKRSTNDEDNLHIDDLLLNDAPDKRGRGRKFGFFGGLGKRDDLEMEKRRRRKMFFGSLGKRRPSFFAGLGKRNGDGDDEALMEELEKRARGNRYFFGSLGKRDAMDGEGNEDDVEKRRMPFYGSLGKRDSMEDMDKRGRSRNFRFFGSLGKRDGTSTENTPDFEENEDMEKRRYQQHFFAALGKRADDLDLEKRRRFAFASLGKRLEGSDTDDTDDMEKRRMRTRPSFYGALGKRSNRQILFGGTNSVHPTDNDMYSDQEEHSRQKRSVSSYNLSRALRNVPRYGRARRFNRFALGQRLIRRTQDFRFFPQLGKRSSDTGK